MSKGLRFLPVLLALLALSCSAQAQEAQKPNFVLIVTDDMAASDLQHMPLTQEHLASKGMTFSSALVSDPLCCPSRATILTGLYPHNHGIWSIYNQRGGGARGMRVLEGKTIASKLQATGYTTGLAGKYANGYDGSWVPSGWDWWRGMVGNEPAQRYSLQGRTVGYRGAQADLLANQADAFLSETEGPFFLHLGPWAPHGPADVAARHADLFAGWRAPRTPAFNERDVSDKPANVRKRRMLDAGDRRALDHRYRGRLRSLQAVDEMVASIVTDLEAAGKLDNTYIALTSDNGWLQGEHRIRLGKVYPYEESVKVPLVVRGPGVAEGVTSESLVLNNDLAPTLADLAGVGTPEVDGRSLAPLLSGLPELTWRDGALVETRRERRPDGAWVNPPTYQAVRTAQYKYIEYTTGEKELYDLEGDPYELENLAGQRPELESDLSAKLDALKSCAGDTCRSAEN